MEESSDRMPSDDVITRRLNEILEAADLSVTTTTAIRRQLEAEMGVNLTTKKAFIRQQIDIFLQQRRSEDDEEAEGEEEQQQDEDYEDEGRGESEVCQAPELDPAFYESAENQEKENVKKRAAKKEVEPDSKRFQAKIKRAIKDSMPKKKRGGGGGFQKVVKLSPELEAVIGESQIARTQVVKLLWNYIREHNLQVPEDKRQIKCDDALRKVFDVDQIGMFAMQKKLSQHLFPLDEAEAANIASNDEDSTADNAENEEEEPKSKKPKSEKKGKGSAFTAPVRISPGLQKFLGTDEGEVSRQDVTKQLWDYIKSNQLQDPANKKMILCDSKLEELFDCKSFSGFGDMPKLLKTHFLTSDKLS